ncbi:thermonuclease family protein [Salipiger mucosus]|uniref:thermonuclease family protein n=1 Tax=Salipiger mucosus TaxID=263378 RepID=UPI0012EB7C2E|nr:hypothetical protein [Salipiger mucosus]
MQRWVQQVDGTYLLVGLFLGLFLLAFLLVRFLVSWLFSSRARHQASARVIPMRRRGAWFRWGKSKRRYRWRAPSPLWLVVLAVALAVSFRSDIWPEFGGKHVLTGRVTHVRDGDTIEVSGRAIRLNGLTCDERNTPLGDRATAVMRGLVAGRVLRCEFNGDRTYDREVGRCALSNGQDIGAVLISQRLCGRCARYDPLRTYAAVQREAGRFRGAMPGYCFALW